MSKEALVACVITVGVLLFFGLYRTDSGPMIATSSCSVEEIVVEMDATEHIRFVEELGVTPTGRVLFSYRWVDYGFFDPPFGESKVLLDRLDILDVAR